eukprot:CAMPEP_0115273076 /NCGR_PEP_ID=MMETSP0270-20121206/54956_1 /TAXON_ID=71861 /ORGANISM="Scrippsiella trochoidea, Strain CCMP3099" /LENGTH=433 /DNA_ID=CAMNT_0002689511 /DNA_START=48 /DNA_END=1345 /DNA_ORIENTATION=-
MVKTNQKRKQWRKAKIEDVEDALEDDRLIDKLKRKSIKGKASADEMPELFTVDTAGSCEGLSGASRRAIARAKIFPDKGPKLGLTATEEAKIARAENRLTAGRAAKRRAVDPEVFDLWAEPSAAEKTKLAAEKEEQRASTVRRAALSAPNKAPKTLYQKVSAAPAVLPAHEGQSMNPEAKAFEDVACTAAARELEREQENETLDRKMRPMTAALRDAAGADAVKNMDEEAKVKAFRAMACPSAAAAQEGDWEEDGPAGEVRRNKQHVKAQSQRNREKKRKIIDAKQEQIRAQKRLEKSVGELGAINKELKQKTEWEEGRREYRKSMREKQKHLEATEGIVPKGRRLGRTKFAEETIVVPDAEAASKGLRAMPLKGGTAIHERISSIMRRGMLPAPPEISRQEVVRRKKKISKLRKGRKFISPLLRDNVLLQRR